MDAKDQTGRGADARRCWISAVGRCSSRADNEGSENSMRAHFGQARSTVRFPQFAAPRPSASAIWDHTRGLAAESIVVGADRTEMLLYWHGKCAQRKANFSGTIAWMCASERWIVCTMITPKPLGREIELKEKMKQRPSSIVALTRSWCSWIEWNKMKI